MSGCFLGIGSLGFSEFWHGARNPYHVVRDRARFFGKTFAPKIGEMSQKIGFFEFKEKFGQKFSLNLSYNENLSCFLCSCTNSIFEKNLVPEMWAKMVSANQIPGFFNQPFLQSKFDETA